MKKYIFIFGIILFAFFVKVCSNHVEPVSRLGDEEPNYEQIESSIDKTDIQESNNDENVQENNSKELNKTKPKTPEEISQESEIAVQILELKLQTERDPKKRGQIHREIFQEKYVNNKGEKTKIDLSGFDSLKLRVKKFKNKSYVEKDSI